jgi:hypothetical protein
MFRALQLKRDLTKAHVRRLDPVVRCAPLVVTTVTYHPVSISHSLPN